MVRVGKIGGVAMMQKALVRGMLAALMLNCGVAVAEQGINSANVIPHLLWEANNVQNALRG